MTEKLSCTLPERPTARVLLLDEADRLLLMKGRLPGATPGSGAWFTVGGGVEAGESYLDAAAREIGEETGIAAFRLGPVVWVREGRLEIPHPVWFRESYIVARCKGVEPDRNGWNALERELIEDIRWWTVAELSTSLERIFPPGLAARLPAILEGRYPAEPEVIPWA